MKRRLFSLILALALLLAAVPASASASSDYVTACKQSISFNKSYDMNSIAPKTVFLFPLTADMFEWSSGQTKAKEAVTTTQLRNISVDFSFPAASKNTDVIKKISFVTETVDGLKTVCVKLEFITELVSVDAKSFEVTLFLRRSNARMQYSDVRYSGSIANPVVEVNSTKSYIDISNGTVLKPTEYIRNIEIGIGSGIIINGTLFSERKYYGTAKNEITSSDEAMVRKYPSIVGIHTLKTVNLKASGNIVLLEGYGSDYYAYNSSGKYLGETGSWMEYSDKYYITDKKVDMGGGVVSTSSSSSQSSSVKSSSTGSSASTGTTLTVDSVTKLTQTAVSTAKSNGVKLATVRVKGAKSISPEAVNALVKTASASGMSARLDADTMNGNAVSGRLTMLPTVSVKPSSDISLGVFVSSTTVTNVKAKFNKWFKNNIEVISLEHKGSFGMNVTIAAKIKLTNLNTSKLYFYAYNATKNQYQQIKAPNYTVDNKDYLHFTTNIGGEIIVSENALAA